VTRTNYLLIPHLMDCNERTFIVSTSSGVESGLTHGRKDVFKLRVTKGYFVQSVTQRACRLRCPEKELITARERQ